MRIEPEPDEDPIIVYTDRSAINNGKENVQAGAGAYYGPNNIQDMAIQVLDKLLPSNQTG
jgi:hypothetical protein